MKMCPVLESAGGPGSGPKRVRVVMILLIFTRSLYSQMPKVCCLYPRRIKRANGPCVTVDNNYVVCCHGLHGQFWVSHSRKEFVPWISWICQSNSEVPGLPPASEVQEKVSDVNKWTDTCVLKVCIEPSSFSKNSSEKKRIDPITKSLPPFWDL